MKGTKLKHHLHSLSLRRTHSMCLMCSSLACYWLWKQTLLSDSSSVPWGSRTNAQTGWKRLLVSCNCYLIMVLKAPQIFRQIWTGWLASLRRDFRQALWTVLCCCLPSRHFHSAYGSFWHLSFWRICIGITICVYNRCVCVTFSIFTCLGKMSVNVLIRIIIKNLLVKMTLNWDQMRLLLKYLASQMFLLNDHRNRKKVPNWAQIP